MTPCVVYAVLRRKKNLPGYGIYFTFFIKPPSLQKCFLFFALYWYILCWIFIRILIPTVVSWQISKGCPSHKVLKRSRERRVFFFKYQLTNMIFALGPLWNSIRCRRFRNTHACVRIYEQWRNETDLLPGM